MPISASSLSSHRLPLSLSAARGREAWPSRERHLRSSASLAEEGPLTELFERCIDKVCPLVPPARPFPRRARPDASRPQSPLERAQLLVQNNDLERVHTETAHTGQTAVRRARSSLPRPPRARTDPPLPPLAARPQAPALEDNTDLHFVTFVAHNGFLIELDGRRNSPVNHGKLTDKGLLEDAVAVVRRIMDLTNSIQFNLVALSPAGGDDE